MKHAEKTEWTLVLNGADRSELLQAFRGSQWEKRWAERMSLLEEDDPDVGYVVPLDIPDLETLIAVLKFVGHLKPTWGMALSGKADFTTISVNFSLCTKDSGYENAGCSLHDTAVSRKSAIAAKIDEVDMSLEDLRQMIVESQTVTES